MRITVQSDVDTLVFRDSGLRDKGDYWITDKGLKGWQGAVKPRESSTAIPQMDGEYAPSRLTSGGRTVTIQGAITGMSTVEAAELQDRLNDLMNRWLTLTVEDASGARHAECWLADDIDPGFLYSERACTFSVVLFCPDPLKYGVPVTFVADGGVLRVSNAGRVPSWPRVHVEGRVTTLSLALGSDVVSWRGDATSLDLDFRDMLPSEGNVQLGNAFRIPPGGSVVSCDPPSGRLLYPSQSLSPSASVLPSPWTVRVSMTVSPAWR